MALFCRWTRSIPTSMWTESLACQPLCPSMATFCFIKPLATLCRGMVWEPSLSASSWCWFCVGYRVASLRPWVLCRSSPARLHSLSWLAPSVCPTLARLLHEKKRKQYAQCYSVYDLFTCLYFFLIQYLFIFVVVSVLFTEWMKC